MTTIKILMVFAEIHLKIHMQSKRNRIAKSLLGWRGVGRFTLPNFKNLIQSYSNLHSLVSAWQTQTNGTGERAQKQTLTCVIRELSLRGPNPHSFHQMVLGKVIYTQKDEDEPLPSYTVYKTQLKSDQRSKHMR